MAHKKTNSTNSANSTDNSRIQTLRDEVTDLKNELKFAKMDGWGNIFSGMGVDGVDPRKSTTFTEDGSITEEEARRLYRSEGFARRIVTLPVNDMLREGFEITGDTDGLLKDEFKRLKLMKVLSKSLTWARVFGGGLTVMGIDDGGELDTELNINKIKKVDFMKVYDRHRVEILSVYDDPEDERFGQPEMYRVVPLVASGVTVIPEFEVHESRTLFWDGLDVTDWDRQLNLGWGDSVYQATQTQIMDLGVSFTGAARIIDEFVIGSLQIENLQDLIASGRDDYVKKRLRYIDLSKSMIRSVLLGKNEEYSRQSTTVSGMDNLLDKLMDAGASVSGIPRVLLFGEQSKGIGGESAGSIRIYYDDIAAKQVVEVQPNLERVIYLLQIQQDGPFKGKELDDWGIDFNPLWQPTQKEIAETRKTQAETDRIYIQENVLEPEEVSNSRFGQDEYSLETELMFERDEKSLALRSATELAKNAENVRRKAKEQKSSINPEEEITN